MLGGTDLGSVCSFPAEKERADTLQLLHAPV